MTMAMHSLLTVTRSYRIFTCFPFTRVRKADLGTSCSLPDMFYILSLNGGKCNKFHLVSLYFPA